MSWHLEHVASAQEGALHLLDPEIALMDNPRRTPCPPEIREKLGVFEVRFFRASDRAFHTGQIVMDAETGPDIQLVFEELADREFPIVSVIPIVAFRWSDALSMRANNTSGYNYRFIAGTRRLSLHGHGRACDLNPFFSPCVENGRVRPKGACYDPRVPGTVVPWVVRIFRRHGFLWGGHWGNPRDYHHFYRPLGGL